jgi:ubiquinone/menaquinone biosynthesis C-methylase UbiE
MKFIPMILAQQIGRQRLPRTEEPSAITAEQDNVIQYDQVMTTKLAIGYAVGLEATYRARSELTHRQGTVVDLACGPGHYALSLLRYLNYQKLIGVDLSRKMLEVAEKNARLQDLDRQASFQLGDITDMKTFKDNTVDLSSFTDAAHHMSNLDIVGKILREMDRITKPDGLVMLMDLARLRTKELTEIYVNFLGGDYVARGLPNFFDDFRNSMYAAWTSRELQTTIPRNSRRVWCHLVPKGLPTIQMIFGLPAGRQTLLVRRGLPWEPQDCPVPKEMRVEWNLARFTLFSGSKKFVPSSKV